jgi:hypothetical protein
VFVRFEVILNDESSEGISKTDSSLIEKIQQGSEIFKEHPISNTNESMTQQNTKNTKSEKSRKPWTNNKE